ncbi:MAG TPA: copper chaperone [Maritimibacter sp.]|nr:copper chaperone [Maritimibacter sp.]
MTTFSVPNMTCGHCKAKIEDAVLELDDGAILDFDMEAREVDVDSAAGTKAVGEAIKQAGYDAVAKG